MRANVEYAVESGVAGFLVNGLAAEVEFLSPAERETVLDLVVDVADPTPVIAGLGSASEPDLARIAERYLKLGCSGLMVNGAGVPHEMLTSVLREIDSLNPGLIMLQDWDAQGGGIPVPTLLHYVETIPSLNWLKIEVAVAGPKYSELIAQGPDTLQVAGGWAVREMIDGLERGVHAFMPTALHRSYVRIYDLFAEGRRDESRALFERIRPILDFSNQRLEISIAFFKWLLYAQDVYATPNCRIPSARLDARDKPIADELVELAMGLEGPIPTP